MFIELHVDRPRFYWRKLKPASNKIARKTAPMAIQAWSSGLMGLAYDLEGNGLGATSAGIILHFKTQFHAFGYAGYSRFLNGGYMQEYIFAAVAGCEKSITFGGVVVLHFTV
jgi:hypothetical protein